MTAASQEGSSGSTGIVLTLSRPAGLIAGRPPKQRRHLLWLSFVFCVVLPLATAILYFGAVATDRYAARAGFAIRGIETGAGLDSIGALTGMASSGSTTSDSYIVSSYLRSRALLEAVDDSVDLRARYTSPEVDWLSRLKPEATVEDFVSHWNRMISTQFDPASGIIEFEVQSFSPQHARDIADLVLVLTQTLVNELSANARRDALSFSREEVALKEARLRGSLAALRDFRASEQSVNPMATAALEIELIASLEARLIDVKARIAALRQTLDEDAPSLVALRRNAEALAAQIADRQQAIGSDPAGGTVGDAVPRQLALYETLEVEISLAQQAYASALASLEQARRDADRQQRYLAVYLRPQVAEASEHPRRLRNVLVIAFSLLAAWGIGTLITYSVRDHLT